jgi:RasGEF domain
LNRSASSTSSSSSGGNNHKLKARRETFASNESRSMDRVASLFDDLENVNPKSYNRVLHQKVVSCESPIGPSTPNKQLYRLAALDQRASPLPSSSSANNRRSAFLNLNFDNLLLSPSPSPAAADDDDDDDELGRDDDIVKIEEIVQAIPLLSALRATSSSENDNEEEEEEEKHKGALVWEHDGQERFLSSATTVALVQLIVDGDDPTYCEPGSDFVDRLLLAHAWCGVSSTVLVSLLMSSESVKVSASPDQWFLRATKIVLRWIKVLGGMSESDATMLRMRVRDMAKTLRVHGSKSTRARRERDNALSGIKRCMLLHNRPANSDLQHASRDVRAVATPRLMARTRAMTVGSASPSSSSSSSSSSSAVKPHLKRRLRRASALRSSGGQPLLSNNASSSMTPRGTMTRATTARSTRRAWSALNETSAKKIAQQLALLESEQLAQLRLVELRHKVQGTPHQSTATCDALIDRTNSLMHAFAHWLLAIDDDKERVAATQKLVEIGHCSLKLRNYSSVMTVVGTLNFGPVSRLRDTLAALSSRHCSVARRLERAVSSYQNFKLYRELVEDAHATSKPHVPFLGINLRDLTALGEVPSIAADRQHARHINVPKLLLVGRNLKMLSTCQRLCAHYPTSIGAPLPAVRKWLVNPPLTSDDMLYKLSYRIEPLRSASSSSSSTKQRRASRRLSMSVTLRSLASFDSKEHLGSSITSTIVSESPQKQK